jgi:hypothetical protein
MGAELFTLQADASLSVVSAMPIGEGDTDPDDLVACHGADDTVAPGKLADVKKPQFSPGASPDIHGR